MKEIFEYESGVLSRSISPENPTGEKGKGGMAAPDDPGAAFGARELGVGWKVMPCYTVPAGETKLLGEVNAEGIIRHIWITMTANSMRKMILRIYWDGAERPAVECPVSDFFACAGEMHQVSSAYVCVNPNSAMNCFFDMPFRRRFKVTVQNLNDENVCVYYQIDYQLRKVSADALYFHAQFRRDPCLAYKVPYEILSLKGGKGKYIGTYLFVGVANDNWWGEGELKIYTDGDKTYPTYCGTGTEDYFLGAWDFDCGGKYTAFSNHYSGFYPNSTDDLYRVIKRFSMYRWHIQDAFSFDSEIRVNIQALGWKSNGRYLPMRNDMSSVAYFYFEHPSSDAVPLPDRDGLEIV